MIIPILCIVETGSFAAALICWACCIAASNADDREFTGEDERLT